MRKRSFAPFCALIADLRLRSFALILRSFARICRVSCVRPRLERPRLGTAENTRIAKGEAFATWGKLFMKQGSMVGRLSYAVMGSAKGHLNNERHRHCWGCAAMASSCSSVIWVLIAPSFFGHAVESAPIIQLKTLQTPTPTDERALADKRF